MGIATGTSLVLLTWSAAAVVLVAFGLALALTVSPSRSLSSVLRISLWWGLGLIATLGLLVNLGTALSGRRAALVMVTLCVLSSVAGALMVRQRHLRSDFTRPELGGWILIAALGFAAVYLAMAALGPVTNYDSGLYHLGAIRYASEFPTIPGLANLYFPFGYSTSQFPLAALLTNSPLGGEGFRLLNGFIMFLASTDLVLRLLAKKKTPGLFVLAAGVLATWVPMIALSDYWVTSPSQDSAALVLTVVTSAYFIDAVAARGGWLPAGSTAIAIGVVLVSVRLTLASYVVVAALLLLVLTFRRRPPAGIVARTGIPVVVLAVSIAAALGLRDRVLSGWLGYPASVFALDVPWRAADPSQYRNSIMGFHRNPEDIGNSIEGWNWLGSWLSSRSSQWETYEFIALVVVALILTALALKRPPTRRLIRWLLVGQAPSAVAVIAWWLVTPPSYRFIWGPLFTLATVPIGLTWWHLVHVTRRNSSGSGQNINASVALCAFPVVVVTLASAAFRFDWAAVDSTYRVAPGIDIAIAPVAEASTVQKVMPSGLPIDIPVESDQCWASYPLCSPDPTPGLTLIGQSIEQGFASGQDQSAP